MKSDTTATALNFILAVLVILGVVFALFSIFRARDLRSVAPVAIQVNSRLMLLQSLVNDVNNYNQQAKSPEITRMMQDFQAQVSNIK
jgi:hypothetical protein